MTPRSNDYAAEEDNERVTVSIPLSEKSIQRRETLQAVAATDGPVAFTSEVADDLGLSKPATIDRLETLEEMGLVAKKGDNEHGGATVWWISVDPMASATSNQEGDNK